MRLSAKEESSLCRQLSGEELEATHHGTGTLLLLTRTKAIKLVPSEGGVYREGDLRFEALWDEAVLGCECPIVDIAHRHISALVMPRMPDGSRLMRLLVNGCVRRDQMAPLLRGLLQNHVPQEQPETVGKGSESERFRSNLEVQVGHLDRGVLYGVSELVAEYLCHAPFEDDFDCAWQRGLAPQAVHGDCFSPNLYMRDNGVVALDPLPRSHPASISYPISDIACLMVDMAIFLRCGLEGIVRLVSELGLNETEECLALHYVVLKLCVRIRYSSARLKMSNREPDMTDKRIVASGPTVLVDALQAALQKMA